MFTVKGWKRASFFNGLSFGRICLLIKLKNIIIRNVTLKYPLLSHLFNCCQHDSTSTTNVAELYKLGKLSLCSKLRAEND